MPGTFPPQLFRTRAPSVVVNEYTAVYLQQGEFGVDLVHLWHYIGGQFFAEIAVVDPGFEPSGIIHEDPSGSVGPNSIYGRGITYDPSAETLYTYSLASPGGNAYGVIWGGDGWLYFITGSQEAPFDGTFFYKIRADGTGETLISSVDGSVFGGRNYEGGLTFLAGDSYYATGFENFGADPIITRLPLDGSDPTHQGIEAGGADLPDEPWRPGLPVPGDRAIYLLTNGTEVRLWEFQGPSTRTALWPSSWATWASPNPGDSPLSLSHSLSPDGSEVAVYQANGGILRVPTTEQTGAAPDPVLVSDHEGMTPDFMLARD